jgi:branched-chain amino acid transport system substrate-binding protein
VKKVYLINQNYAHGHQVARGFKDLLARSARTSRSSATTCTRSARSSDFAPYVAKMRRRTPTR